MKVAHIITRMIVGGAQENTLLSAAGQAALPDTDVLLVTGPETGTEGDLLDEWEGAVRVVVVPNMVRAVRPLKDLRALRSLYILLKAERPDVVHTHSSKAGVLGRLAAKMAGVPVVVHTLHSLVFHDYQPRFVNLVLRAIKRLMVPFTDHYISVSRNIMDRAIAAGIGLPEQHSVVYSGFSTDQFCEDLTDREAARRTLGLPLDRTIVGVVGRLFPLKGHEDALAIVEKIVGPAPETLLLFVGSGPLLDELIQKVRVAGIEDHVEFLGRVHPAEIPGVFSALDVLAHASLREGLARVIPQAVLAGVPVVCYDLDGSSEVVEDDVNGYLIPPRDLDLFARRLLDLVQRPEVQKRLGSASRKTVYRQFSADGMVRIIDNRHRELLAARRGSPARR